MSLGVLPGTSSSAAFHPRLPPAAAAAVRPCGAAAAVRPCGAAAAIAGGNPAWGRGGGLRSAPSRWRAQAAVEEGGFVGMSFYELLEIPEWGSAEEIKRAYKRMARRYHPDVSPPGHAEEHTRRFIEVQEAYETLSDPSRRALYDRHLARGLHLALASRKQFDEELEERSGWKNRWQDQVAELKRRSPDRDSENLSWGARMRRRNAEASTD